MSLLFNVRFYLRYIICLKKNVDFCLKTNNSSTEIYYLLYIHTFCVLSVQHVQCCIIGDSRAARLRVSSKSDVRFQIERYTVCAHSRNCFKEMGVAMETQVCENIFSSQKCTEKKTICSSRSMRSWYGLCMMFACVHDRLAMFILSLKLGPSICCF